MRCRSLTRPGRRWAGTLWQVKSLSLQHQLLANSMTGFLGNSRALFSILILRLTLPGNPELEFQDPRSGILLAQVPSHSWTL